jgi:holin-like protein
MRALEAMASAYGRGGSLPFVRRRSDAAAAVLDGAVGLAILSAFWAAGEGLARALPAAPLTGSLWGMLALFVALSGGWLPERRVRRAAAVLVRWLGLLFVPVGVGVLAYGELLARQAGAVALAIGAGSVATLLATAWAARRVARRKDPRA